MRSLLLALPFAVLPLTAAFAHDEHDHSHGSLSAHEHGVAQLNVALDGNSLELELHSPAMNLVGFEHKAQSDQDKKAVEMAKQQLANPITLFGIPAAAGCKVSKTMTMTMTIMIAMPRASTSTLIATSTRTTPSPVKIQKR